MNLGAISTLVFDLDGVVWRGDAPIESAILAINRLRDAGKRCLFCTNMSAMTQTEFVEKMANMGLKDVPETDVVTSSVATFGCGNPFLSLLEDIAAFFLTLAALLLPIVVPVLVVIFAFVLWRLIQAARKLSPLRKAAPGRT